jgi:hypothetical protein
MLNSAAGAAQGHRLARCSHNTSTTQEDLSNNKKGTLHVTGCNASIHMYISIHDHLTLRTRQQSPPHALPVLLVSHSVLRALHLLPQHLHHTACCPGLTNRPNRRSLPASCCCRHDHTHCNLEPCRQGNEQCLTAHLFSLSRTLSFERCTCCRSISTMLLVVIASRIAPTDSPRVLPPALLAYEGMPKPCFSRDVGVAPPPACSGRCRPTATAADKHDPAGASSKPPAATAAGTSGGDDTPAAAAPGVPKPAAPAAAGARMPELIEFMLPALHASPDGGLGGACVPARGVDGSSLMTRLL